MKALRGPFEHAVDHALSGEERRLGEGLRKCVDSAVMIGVRVSDEDRAQTLAALPNEFEKLLDVALDESTIDQEGVLPGGYKHSVRS